MALLMFQLQSWTALDLGVEGVTWLRFRWPLNGDLAAAALEKPAWGESLSTDLARRVVNFEAQHLSGESLVHCWATTDCCEAFIAASQLGGLDDVVVAIDTVTQIQTRLMSSQYEQLIKKTKFGK